MKRMLNVTYHFFLLFQHIAFVNSLEVRRVGVHYSFIYTYKYTTEYQTEGNTIGKVDNCSVHNKPVNIRMYKRSLIYQYGYVIVISGRQYNCIKEQEDNT